MHPSTSLINSWILILILIIDSLALLARDGGGLKVHLNRIHFEQCLQCTAVCSPEAAGIVNDSFVILLAPLRNITNYHARLSIISVD